MNKLLLSLIIGLFFGGDLFAVSAYRVPGVDYRYYEQGLESKFKQSNNSASSNKTSLSKIDFSSVPDYGSFEIAMAVFRQIRDMRFLQDPNNQSSLRRSSWLYPHDGCFARAQLAVNNLQGMGLKPPMKMFIFGDLEVKTSYSSTGSVTWWYHVVPLVRVGNNLLVLDPAIEMNHPLFLSDWILRQDMEYALTNDTNAFSLCGSMAYTPSSNCKSGDLDAVTKAYRQQANYLNFEKSNLKQLRLPMSLLGDKPPWY